MHHGRRDRGLLLIVIYFHDIYKHGFHDVWPQSNRPLWLTSLKMATSFIHTPLLPHWTQRVQYCPGSCRLLSYWTSHGHEFLLIEYAVSGKLLFTDALCAAPFSKDEYVITSPNMSWVPLLTLGSVDMHIRDDTLYGHHDPIQWPQQWVYKMPHLCIIALPPDEDDDPHHIMWWRPGREEIDYIDSSVMTDFERLRRSHVMTLKSITSEVLNRRWNFVRADYGSLEFCLDSMELALQCLSLPATYCDIILQLSNLQRYWLESNAWMDWTEIYRGRCVRMRDSPYSVNHKLMGAFTSDPDTVQKLYRGGIPVWYIRWQESISTMDTVLEFASPDLPEHHDINLNCDRYPSPSIYSGPVGLE